MGDNLILSARYVVTMDGDGTVYSPGYVEVDGMLIKSTGPNESAPEGKRISYGNAAIIPGLINSHNHLAMSLMRGVADDIPLEEWLQNHIWPLEGKFLSPEYIYDGTLLSAVEMLKSGTTFTTDMYFFEDDVARACKRARIRCMIGEGALAFPTASIKDPDTVFDVIRKQAETYQTDELISVHVAAHSTYATTEEQLVRCAELSKELDVPIQIHCAESKKEVEESLAKRGKSQVAYLGDLGFLDKRIGLVHMVWPQETDWELLKKENVSVISCLESNLKLASGIPPMFRYVDENIRVCLGTDGAASNNNLDIWGEIRLAAFIAKGQSLNPTTVPAERALRMVTSDAAKVWGLDSYLGSIEKGKAADIVIIDLDRPNTTPCYDIYSTLVYATGASNVRDVYVAGKPVVKDGTVTTVDETEVLTKAREWARRIKSK